MKILNIHFKNINSLEGENRVDFEQTPFSDTGVFAITGPNGAGKSTILDAITLGLYGETFRFDRPARHVMTQHTNECFSKIDFILDKEKYRSSWLVRRENADPDAEVMPAQMQLLRLSDGEVLATTAQQVCARITEITGMNFRNFTRSILLAQGDFAAFLNALDNERMDILEKIISVDIYADYKKQITDKAAVAQQHLAYLQQDLSIIPLMDAEKREACELDLNDFIEQKQTLRQQQNRLEQEQAAQQNRLALQQRIDEQEKNLQQAQTLKINDQEKLDRLATAQEALLFKDDAEAIRQKSQALHQNKATLTDFVNELKQIQEHIGTDTSPPAAVAQQSFTEQTQTITGIKAQIGQLTAQRQSEAELWQSLSLQIDEKKSVLATVSTWLEAHSADQSLLESFPETARLKNLRAERVELTEKQKTFAKQSKNTSATLKNNQSALEQERKKVAELKLKLPLSEKALDSLAQGKQLPELEAFLQDRQERVNDFRELYRLAKANQKLSPGGFSFFAIFGRKEQPNHDIEELSLQIETLKKDISREENIRNVLEMAVFQESLLKKMAADRHHLVDGEPCFLCGASVHPYVDHPPQETDSRQALTDQQTTIKNLTAALGKLEQQLKTAQKLADKEQTNQTELLKIRAQWLTLCNRLNAASEELNINKLVLIQQLLNTELGELKLITSVVNDYQRKKADIEQIKVAITQGEATIERLQLVIQQLDSQWQQRPQDEIDYDAALAGCRQQEQQLASQVIAQLTALGEKIPAKGKEDALFDRLNARRQDYQGYDLRCRALTGERDMLTAKMARCQAEIASCNEKIEHYRQQLHQEEIVGLHLALIEKQKLIADKERDIAQLETELAALKQVLQHKIQGTPFTSLHELTEILALLEHQPELERHLAELEQEIDAKTIELETSRGELSAETTLTAGMLSPEQWQADLKSVSEKIDIADLEIQRLERLLAEQQQFQQKADTLLIQLQDQQQATELCLAEAAQITEESGMDFRRRVQKRVADQLLSQTNAVLEKISGRYYLRQMPSEQGLALAIEDTYQSNARRLPKTLSGGESFVVSLALALGLSELSNNGKSVDSLFLDEGFGNLDAETLYTVISTLENLHTHGKTVGVISHVEGVQKRFKAQLQVVKKPNGMGMLKQAS